MAGSFLPYHWFTVYDGDNTFSVTISNEYLPFFYEMGLLSCNPYPISVIAPGVSVLDDGEGVYLENSAGPGGAPVYTAELLNRTLNDPLTGYRTHPSVVSGPYMLTSFDGTTAEFIRNPYFKGTAEGEMPLIETITYTLCDNDTMIAKLENGEFDLLNKVTNVSTISEGIDYMAGGEAGMSNYPRIGLSYISFAWERPTVSSRNVRQAIAYCMDRNAVVADYTGNFGIRVDGYYGVGQWMYGVVNGTVAPPVDPPENQFDPVAMAEYERELEAWQELSLENLTDYELDPDRARALLESDGWTLNADGVREKWINGERVTLDLSMLIPEGNRIADAFEEYLIPNLEQVGIRLTMKEASMPDILKEAYKVESRDVDMIYFASNFEMIFDPSVFFILNNGLDENWSLTNHTDRTVYDLAVDMRKTEPGEVLEYMQKWVAFQEQFNSVLPMIPIYSNVYFDFYTNLLNDYEISERSTWGEAIIGATKASIPEIPEEEITDEIDTGDGSGTMTIEDF